MGGALWVSHRLENMFWEYLEDWNIVKVACLKGLGSLITGIMATTPLLLGMFIKLFDLRKAKISANRFLKEGHCSTLNEMQLKMLKNISGGFEYNEAIRREVLAFFWDTLSECGGVEFAFSRHEYDSCLPSRFPFLVSSERRDAVLSHFNANRMWACPWITRLLNTNTGEYRNAENILARIVTLPICFRINRDITNQRLRNIFDELSGVISR